MGVKARAYAVAASDTPTYYSRAPERCASIFTPSGALKR